MLFVELEHVNGQDILVAVAHISAIEPTSKGSMIVLVNGVEYEVNHTPAAIWDSITGESE
jgi:hypothetical protein